jgi:hypothetical protein
MPETVEHLIRRAAGAACLTLALTLSALPAAAQPPSQPVVSPAPSAPDVLTRADFHLAAGALAVDDQRFSWDTHFGGSLDLVDYVVGRTSIAVDYEAVLGDEYRAFDPNQGNYTLEAATSARIGGSTEVVGMLHHVSRHLSDRPKRFAIAWNVLGGRVMHQVKIGDLVVDGDLEGGKVVQHSYADYDWIGELHLQARKPVNARTTLYGRAGGQWIGVTGEIPDRGRQAGGNVEVGVRITGKVGALELFAGAERRADADPLDRLPKNWALAGFRLTSR